VLIVRQHHLLASYDSSRVDIGPVMKKFVTRRRFQTVG
jgi:hypothetical protein